MSSTSSRWKLWLLTLALVAGLGALGACAGETGPEGKQGEQGPEGEPGEPGEDGEDGEDGDDGATSLTETEEVEEGDECEAGGVRVNTGIDENDDGELSEDEVTSSEVICHSPNADCSAFEITEVSGTDQSFYEGVQSDPITVEHDGGDDVEVQFIGSAFAYEDGSEDDETVLTPHHTGGPFQVTIIAKNDCSVDVDSFVVDEVEPAVSTSYAAHFFGPAGQVEVAESGDDEAVFTLDYTEADGPVDFEPDSYEFDVIDENGDVVATTDSLDLDLGDTTSIVAYPDEVDEPSVEFLHIDDDWSEPGSDEARLRAANLNPEHDTVNIVEGEEDSSSDLFTGVDFGDTSSADTFDPDVEIIGVDTDDDDEVDVEFGVEEDTLEEGDSINLFVYGDDEYTGVALQHLGDEGATDVLSYPPTYEESFEDSDSDLPGDFSTGGDSDWGIDTNESTDGDNSAVSDGTATNEYSELEVELDVDSAGELRFDWKTEGGSEYSDYLSACVDPGGDCYNTISNDSIGYDTDWEEGRLTIDEAGTYTIVWAVQLYGSEMDGWVDNIRFIEE